MNSDYFQTHLELGLYLHELMGQTNLSSIEISVGKPFQTVHKKDLLYSNKMYQFNSFIALDDKFKLIEWSDNPNALLNIYIFDKTSLSYSYRQFNEAQFTEFLYQKFPLLQDDNFLNFFYNNLPYYDCDKNAYARINRASLAQDMNMFFDSFNRIYKKYQFAQHLNTTLALPSNNSNELIKV